MVGKLRMWGGPTVCAHRHIPISRAKEYRPSRGKYYIACEATSWTSYMRISKGCCFLRETNVMNDKIDMGYTPPHFINSLPHS